MRSYKTDDGWLVLTDREREVIRVKLPPGKLTRAEIKAFERHLIANMYGAN